MESVNTILDYWFGADSTALSISDAKQKLWWGKDDVVDRTITRRFAAITARLARGEHADWLHTPRGQLATIICFDQFPRNMFRGEAAAFAHDPAALKLAKTMVAQGDDQPLPPIFRVFAYLPFEHSETLADQQQSLDLYGALRDGAPAAEYELFANFYEFARKHQAVIAQFNRFPHRNVILDRTSTAAEQEFLLQPGSSF